MTITLDRIDAAGAAVAITQTEAALRQGEPLHRVFRPDIPGDYVEYMNAMGAEGAGIIQLFDEGEVRAIAVWRTYLTTFTGRRFEVDDLTTTEGSRSKGYGATMMRALEAKAKSLKCDAITLTSATWRVDAHRFYLRERFAIRSFFFSKALG